MERNRPPRTEARTGAPKHARERRSSTRFPLALDLRYTIAGLRGQEAAGLGRTIDLGSSGLSFTADRPLSIGQRLELSIHWPVLLNAGVQLQLILSGVIVRVDGAITAVEIQRHEFRTRSLGPKLVVDSRNGSAGTIDRLPQ